MKCLCLGQFLCNCCSYSHWYLVHAYIFAWPLECSHPYLTLTSISQSIRHATLSYLLIKSFWILIRMFALISSRSGSQSNMILRWALQGHHGPLVLSFLRSIFIFPALLCCLIIPSTEVSVIFIKSIFNFLWISIVDLRNMFLPLLYLLSQPSCLEWKSCMFLNIPNYHWIRNNI